MSIKTKYTLEELDRSVYEQLRLSLVAAGKLPNIRSFVGNSAGFEAAVKVLHAAGNLVYLNGVGAPRARDGVEMSTLSINRKPVTPGTIGLYGVVTYTPSSEEQDPDLTYKKELEPDHTKNVPYELRLFTSKVSDERFIAETIFNTLGTRKYIPCVLNDGTLSTTKGFWLFFQGEQEVQTGTHIEKVYQFLVEDVLVDKATLLDATYPSLLDINWELGLLGTTASETVSESVFGSVVIVDYVGNEFTLPAGEAYLVGEGLLEGFERDCPVGGDVTLYDFAGNPYTLPAGGSYTAGEGILTDFEKDCPTFTAVTVNVNGSSVSANSGQTVNVTVTQGGVQVGTITVTGLNVAVVIPAASPATVTVNTAFFDTVASGGSVDVPVVTTEDNPIGAIVSGKVIIPNTNVNVNGQLLASVGAGSTVPGQVVDERNDDVGIHSTGHKWLIRDARLFINTVDVDELRPEQNKLLTVTLNGAPTTPTYTAGTINVTTATPTDYCGLPLDIPTQNGVVVNAADTGAASLLNAYITPFPAGYAGYNSLDLTDPTGSTLLQNNVLFGTKNRFTNLTGTANTYTAVNWLDGAGVTRTARLMIDHLYGNKGIYLLLTDDAGRWSSEWPTRLNNATYNGNRIYPASRGMLEALQRYDVSALNQLEAYMGHSGLVFSGEVPVSSTGTVYSMTGITLGTAARNTFLKVLLFTQIP